MKKLKHEGELFKVALLAAMKYAEGRGAVVFEEDAQIDALSDAVAKIDRVAQDLLASGFRKEAMMLLDLNQKLEIPF